MCIRDSVYATLNNSAEITYELNAGDYGTGGGEEPDPGPEKADWYIHGQTCLLYTSRCV